MSNAKATIRSSIINGLAKSAHITGASCLFSTIQTEDIIESLFHESVRWSIKEYLKELEGD